MAEKIATTIYRDGLRIGVSVDTEEAWMNLQKQFVDMPSGCILELPEGVEILSARIDDGSHIGALTRASHGYSFRVVPGGHMLVRDPA
jgi:hypothetical protein